MDGLKGRGGRTEELKQKELHLVTDQRVKKKPPKNQKTKLYQEAEESAEVS